MGDLKIFGVRIDNTDTDAFKSALSKSLKSDKKFKVSKVNTEFLVRALVNNDFKYTLNDSDLNIVDGRGVLWAAKYLSIPVSANRLTRICQSLWQLIYSGLAIVINPSFVTSPLKATIPGVEAFEATISVAAEKGVGIYLFGATDEILLLAIDNINKKFPGIIISGSLNGYDFQNDSNIDPISIINKTDARLLFVALGSPKQEYWIAENLPKLKNIKIAIGEGGTLDRVAYPSEKSPKFINKIGLEWLWRLLFNKSKTETRNRFQRFWNSVPIFISKVVRWKIDHGTTETNK